MTYIVKESIFGGRRKKMQKYQALLVLLHFSVKVLSISTLFFSRRYCFSALCPGHQVRSYVNFKEIRVVGRVWTTVYWLDNKTLATL